VPDSSGDAVSKPTWRPPSGGPEVRLKPDSTGFETAVRWYRSFYFRIGFTFVLFVAGLIVLQGVVSNAVRMRSPLRGRSPNAVVAIVAADVGALLDQNPKADVDEYLKREYAQSQPIYVVMRDGSTASNRTAPLALDMRRYVDRMLTGSGRGGVVEPRVAIPFVMAPIQVDGGLRAIVVLPPSPAARGGGPGRDIDRIASIPGTALLVLLTVVAAAVIFEPARRRLKLLQQASVRLGSGDLTARAPATGGDEVAQVAASFNRMAEELAAREKALRTSDRLRRQMLADVSHELKTPLTAMRSYVETLRAEDIALDRDTRERYFATLERETIRLDRILKDLLDLARLENNVVHLDLRVFAARRVFEHVVGRHRPEIERRRIQVRIDVAAAADQMVADPDRIEQVVENLFANGLRHTPDRGSLTLAATLDDSVVNLRVTDSGSGIPPEHLPHVFERFYKVDVSRANESGGSGLGLSVSRAIVERHGGQITVSSRPGYTVFTIALPQSESTNL
jgi:signal transduction histidine kinase